jgi:uncharacterized membrane protein
MMPADNARFESTIIGVLRWGARTSTVLLAAGLLLEFLNFAPTTGVWLTRLGLIVLMATPVARVVASVLEYVREKDWLFAALTATVLTILVGSLLVAVR